MAKKKSSKSKSSGLGLGLDALIKAKTKPAAEREDDFLSEPEETQPKIEKSSSKPKEDVNTEKTPKKVARKPRTRKTKKSLETKKSNYSSKESSPKSDDSSSVSTIDNQRVDAVLNEVRKNPRISLWSARSAAVLRYLKKTQPEFSISNEASKLIEEAVKDKYPEIWAMFDDL